MDEWLIEQFSWLSTHTGRAVVIGLGVFLGNNVRKALENKTFGKSHQWQIAIMVALIWLYWQVNHK